MEQFLNEHPQAFEKTKTVEFIATPGLCKHQVDLGLATAGTISIFPDCGTGYKPAAHTVVTMATQSTIVLIEGIIKSFKLVPANISNDGFTASYSAGAS